MFDLKGKFAVITGAASGIGADAAAGFAQAGAAVAIFDINEDMLELVKAKIIKDGGRCIAVKCDVSNAENVKAAVDTVLKEFGRIDILINNAGTVIFNNGVHNTTEEEWDKVVDVNLKSMFLMSKYIVPGMMKQKYGKIVNIASINAVIGDKVLEAARHSYNASKSGVIGLTMGMAGSYAQFGITVNCVAPGLFETGFTKDTIFKNPEQLAGFNAFVPAGRPANKGELNGTLMYLSSDASSYTQGQLIVVDGGLTKL